MMNNPNSRFIIHLSLQAKYEHNFSFFMIGPIDHIIFDQHKSNTNLNYKEAIIASHQTQYLRRQYWLQNSMSQPQIYDRISMLANFYTTNHFVSSHYPLMILTNTKYIFGKRIRRLRKTVAFDNSSDGQESMNTFSGRFSTLGFLRPSQMAESIGSSSLSSISRFSNLSKGISYESSIHDVYEGKIQIQMIQPAIFEDDGNVDQLIIDFYDLDPIQTVQDYAQLKRRMSKQKEQPLQKLYDKPVYSSIMVNEPLSLYHRNNSAKKQERAEKLSQLKKNQRRTMMLNTCRKPTDNRQTQDKQYEHSNKKYGAKEEEDDSKETRRKKRQRIRDKATQLLNRVKSEEYINYHFNRPSSTKKDI